jgi:hypothetical protein
MDYEGREHAVFLRHLAHGITTAIRREEHFWTNSQGDSARAQLEEFKTELKPAMVGSGIVTSVALIDHLITRNSDGSWQFPIGWYGKKEFNNFRIIRHCFAHAAGRILPNRKNEIEEFLQDLVDGNVLNREDQVIQPYYALEGDFVVPYPESLNRLRLLSTELLAELNLVAKFY